MGGVINYTDIPYLSYEANERQTWNQVGGHSQLITDNVGECGDWELHEDQGTKLEVVQNGALNLSPLREGVARKTPSGSTEKR